MAQRTHLLIGLPLGPSAACPSKPFFGVLPLYRTVKDQERHSIIFSQVSLTAVSLGIQVRSSWDSATLFFVSKHLIDKTCTESCSKNGAESPWSANGRGNSNRWAKSRVPQFRAFPHLWWFFLASLKNCQIWVFAGHAFQNICLIQAQNPLVWKEYPDISSFHNSLAILLQSYWGSDFERGWWLQLTKKLSDKIPVHISWGQPIRAQLCQGMYIFTVTTRLHSSQHGVQSLGFHKHSAFLLQISAREAALKGWVQLTFLPT